MSSVSVSSEALDLLLSRIAFVALKLWLMFSIFLLSVFLPSLPPLHFSLSLRLPFFPHPFTQEEANICFP